MNCHRIRSEVVYIFLMCSMLTSCVSPGLQAASNEAYTVVEILTQSESFFTQTEAIEVRNCCGPTEVKQEHCSSGLSTDLTIMLEAGGEISPVAVMGGASTALGLGRDRGETLGVPEAPRDEIHRYSLITTYTLIAGEALVQSSNGQNQKVEYRFFASCSMHWESGPEVQACPAQCSNATEPIPNAVTLEPPTALSPSPTPLSPTSLSPTATAPIYSSELCGNERAFNATFYPYADFQNTDSTFTFPPGYTEGFISSDPGVVEFSDGQTKVFTTQFVLITSEFSWIKVNGVRARQDPPGSGNWIPNTGGCVFFPQDTNKAEMYAWDDYQLKIDHKHDAEIYRVTPAGFELLASNK